MLRVTVTPSSNLDQNTQLFLRDVFVNFSTRQETVWIVSHLGYEHLNPKPSPNHNLVAILKVNKYTRTGT